MYEAPKRYVVASASALAFAILFLLVAIGARSVVPDTAADMSEIKVDLRPSLP